MDVVDMGRGFFWPRPPLRKILPSPTVSPNVPMCLSLPPHCVPPQNDPYCPPQNDSCCPPNDPYCLSPPK